MQIPIIECGVPLVGLIVFAGVAGLGVLFAWGKRNTIAAILAGTIGLIFYLTFAFC